MNNSKPSLPRGTRDFSPEVMVRRNFIITRIKTVFEQYGFLPLETPALENLSVLTGKYGDEGDQLLFKVLNSGNFLDGLQKDDLLSANYKSLTSGISEKGLRYDLTVPFARYVVMNQQDITYPFKRYQIQPVWRADRPQKGRYREFYQCDADVIGTDSLICEAEIVMMVKNVFAGLGIGDYELKFNNRKILEGFTEEMDMAGKAQQFYIILDKLEKVGKEKVMEEFAANGFSEAFCRQIEKVVEVAASNEMNPGFLSSFFKKSKKGMEGLEEINRLIEYVKHLGDGTPVKLKLDYSLARGLSYYTGTIFEAKVKGVQIGSLGGGGRYDNLTGIFGLPGVSGVGFSFGIDRIYDVLSELSIFPELNEKTTKILISNFDADIEKHALRLLARIRNAGINAEIFPDPGKIKKQLAYANKKGIPFVLMVGSEEISKGRFGLKDMVSGTQEELTLDEIITRLGAG